MVRRRWLRIVAAFAALIVGYVAVSAVQVVAAARLDQHRRAQAIVVLGSAEYNGRPSADLVARLSHALALWRGGAAPVIVLTGGRQPGDIYTEASTGDGWLQAHHVPNRALITVVQGTDTWRSMTAAAAVLGPGRRSVILVSDPFHDERIRLMAASLGLDAQVSPTTTSPIRGSATIPYFAKETVEVAAGRIIGFRRLAELIGG